ncbi:Uncharacterised protein [Mycobacterium tuberculosis]|nr:Uncharacterised protein [Mycobacterium tuberculosis]
MSDEGRKHQHQDDTALDEQPAIVDGFALVERQHVGNSVGLGSDGAQQPGQQTDQGDHDDEHGRGHVDQEVVERQSRPAGDDDVRRVADQRGRAADIGREDFGHQKRRGIDPQSITYQ